MFIVIPAVCDYSRQCLFIYLLFSFQIIYHLIGEVINISSDACLFMDSI